MFYFPLLFYLYGHKVKQYLFYDDARLNNINCDLGHYDSSKCEECI